MRLVPTKQPGEELFNGCLIPPRNADRRRRIEAREISLDTIRRRAKALPPKVSVYDAPIIIPFEEPEETWIEGRDVPLLLLCFLRACEINGGGYRAALREAIIWTVCEKHGVTLKDLRERCRKRRNTRPRFELCYLLHTELDKSLPSIAELLGIDHTSVLHGVQRWRKILREEEA
ncbi:MAG: hypothetical protein JJ902_03895 [Roseibium sp.]|nr:hypothetical protein [Roseibium sp.]